MGHRKATPRLTARFIETVKPGPRTKLYCDGGGLYLCVQPTGSKQWKLRTVIRGRRRDVGLGGYPLVSLVEAREAAFEGRKEARAGGPLSGLALSANSQAVALTPAFSPGVLSYRAEVPAGTTGVSLAPSWGALAELAGSPTVFLASQGPATLLAQTQVHASGTAAALALSSAGPTGLEVTVLEPDGSGKPLAGDDHDVPRRGGRGGGAADGGADRDGGVQQRPAGA